MEGFSEIFFESKYFFWSLKSEMKYFLVSEVKYFLISVEKPKLLKPEWYIAPGVGFDGHFGSWAPRPTAHTTNNHQQSNCSPGPISIHVIHIRKIYVETFIWKNIYIYTYIVYWKVCRVHLQFINHDLFIMKKCMWYLLNPNWFQLNDCRLTCNRGGKLLLSRISLISITTSSGAPCLCSRLR